MRAFWIWCLVLTAVVVGHPAAATVDGGYEASLLAVGGKNQRFAIVQYGSIQEECYAGCETFIVDTRATAFKRLHVETIKVEEDGMLAAYLQKLPEAMRKKLEPVKSATDLPRLSLDKDDSKPNDLAFDHNGKTLRVGLAQLWTAPSMIPYDKHHDETLARCVDLQKGEAICSSCRKVTRWLDGEKLSTWACSGPGQFPEGYVEGDRRCDCSARAPLNVLTAKWDKRGVARRGSKILVEPFKLWWDGGSEGLPKVDLGGALDDEGGVAHTSIEAIVLEKSVLVLGAAVHARYANGTYLPVVAAIPR